MVAVKVVNEGKKDLLGSLTKYLTISLSILTLLIIFISHETSITGYSVFSGTYGAASPFLITGLLAVIIFLYLRMR